jgi:hypothetical protein
MRRAEIAAYITAGLSAVAYAAIGINSGGWVEYSDMIVGSAIVAALGYALGRRHRAWAAIGLMVYLILVTVLRILADGRPPALLIVGILGWLYFEGFQAAREYAALKGVQLEPSAPAA